MALSSEVPGFVITPYFEASIRVLMKKEIGIRPIAAGNTLRRLATNVVVKPLSVRLDQEIRLIQFECEAASHTVKA